MLNLVQHLCRILKSIRQAHSDSIGAQDSEHTEGQVQDDKGPYTFTLLRSSYDELRKGCTLFIFLFCVQKNLPDWEVSWPTNNISLRELVGFVGKNFVSCWKENSTGVCVCQDKMIQWGYAEISLKLY